MILQAYELGVSSVIVGRAEATGVIAITRQIAGTMTIEGMQLISSELAVIKECADGKRSSTKEIQSLIDRYTVK